MSHPELRLPDSWVEKIWQAMRATYGATFDRQWECAAGADPVEHVAMLKAFWGRELGALQGNPAAIRYGLENLPTFPPNLVQFREICNRRPDVAPPQLPAPKADPARVRELLSGLKIGGGGDGRSMAAGCAADLRQRIADGQKLTQSQRWVLECCEKHVSGSLSESAVLGAFQTIDAAVLPPAMREPA